MNDGMKCPECGSGLETGTNTGPAGAWCCRNCGARGGFRDGSPVRERDHHDRLCVAQIALAEEMSRTNDQDFVEKAVNSYARLQALSLKGNRWQVRKHGGRFMSTGWLLPAHVQELDDLLAEAREIVMPNGACRWCDDPECGKVECQDCGKLMHRDDEMVVSDDPAGFSCRSCVYGDDGHSTPEPTDGV